MSLDIGNKAEGRTVDVSVKVAGLQLKAFHLLLVTLCFPYPLYRYASSRLGQMVKLSVGLLSLFKNLNLGFGLPHMPMTTSTGTMDAKEFTKVEQDSKIQLAGDQEEITVLEKDTRIRSDEGAQGPGNITSSENAGRIECKFYLFPGDCKDGNDCRSLHHVQQNFLGLPIRPGEKECPLYMRTGGCEFASHCRFHHPDPSAVVGDSFQDHKNGVPSQHHALVEQLCESPMPSESPSNEQTDFVGTFTPNRGLQENLHRKRNQKRKLKIRSTAFNLEEKKERIIEGGASANEVRVCTTCNVVCNSAKVFASHLAGEKHALKKRKLKIRSTAFNLEEKKQRIIEGGASANEVRVCTTCNVICNSAEVFASHLAGEKHALMALGPNYRTMVPKVMALLKLMKYAKKSAPNKRAGLGYISAPKIVESFSCEVCKIDCNSQESFNTHKMGRKHKANLQKLQEKITPKSATTTKKDISVGQDQITNVEVLKKPSSTKEDLQTKKDKVVQVGAAEDYISAPKIVESFSCEVCKIDCNSQESFNTHKMGRKHKANLQKLQEKITPKSATTKKNISVGQDQITNVEVLKKPSSTKEDLQTKKDKVVQGGAAEDYISAPKIVESFSCEVCKIDCNSQESFNTHKMGRKHKANLQKLQEKITPKSATTTKKNISVGQDQITNVEVLKKPSSTKEDLQTKKDKVVQVGAAGDYISAPKIVESFSCEVCKIDCNSQESFNTHKMGRKHKANLQKLQEKITPKSATTTKKNISGQDQITNVEMFKKPSSTKEDLQTKKDKVVQGGAAEEAIMVCALCDVVCSSKAVYDSHIRGKKHLAMIKKLETQV